MDKLSGYIGAHPPWTERLRVDTLRRQADQSESLKTPEGPKGTGNCGANADINDRFNFRCVRPATEEGPGDLDREHVF